ncbi:MAG: cytochrome c oxidase subunit 3 [Verrucomicrobia bacterium]|nr:cytochrome c oxidase subunit 3 [Verrucomicrobiota bacterium]
MAQTQTAGLQEQFEDLTQQRETSNLGMWIFISTECLFFGGLFLAFTVLRHAYPVGFATAARHLDLLSGIAGTVALLASTLAMSIGLAALRNSDRFLSFLACFGTLACGLIFLGLEGSEYFRAWHEHLVPGGSFQFIGPEAGHVQMFFLLYFVMTGFHALHLTIGLGVIVCMMLLIMINRLHAERYGPLQVAALYWHFVGIIWTLLFPTLYLLGGR